MAKILDRKDEDRAREIDKTNGIKNCFRWAWLENSVTVEIGTQTVTTCLNEHIRKVDVPGKVLCTLCTDMINYGNRGARNIQEHIKTKKHKEKLKISKTNYQLPSSMQTGTTPSSSQPQQMYAMFQGQPEKEPDVKPLISISDRIANSQAMVLGVVAENDLPLSMAPVMIDLAKQLAHDKKALDNLTMDRTTASYRMKNGLAKTLLDRTLDNIRNCKFSLNIDESTSNNNKRVLAILVSYFSKSEGKVVLEHLSSLEVITVDTQSLYNELVNLFQKYEIPWCNLVSILMDSCAVMRGSKNGLEKKIRENQAPHLLDIDGDICHHVHNACKKFCSVFEHWAEGLFSDLHNDTKWSPDLREFMSEICELLHIKFTVPERFVSHRWLSAYDLSVSTLRIMDALQVFYYAFVPADLKPVYHGVILEIYRRKNVSMDNRQRIKDILDILSKKKLTDDGKTRKARIVEKVLYKSKQSQLTMSFYQSALPILKKYVCLFQSKEPLIHLVHDKLDELFRDFLACYIKPDRIPASSHALKQLNLDDADIVLQEKDIFIGTGAQAIIKSSRKDDSTILYFMRKATNAFKVCGKYLQMKLPLDNKLLRSLSCIDPAARGHAVTTRSLKQLEDMILVLDDVEKESFSLQVHQMQSDINLPAYKEDMKVDEWWAMVAISHKYTAVCKLVFALMTIFHGPQVESSFNTMGDIIDIRSCRMKVETYSSIQTVKYYLKTRNSSAVKYFTRKDILHDSIDKKLCINFRKSASEYKEELNKKKKAKNEKMKRLQIKSQLQSKEEAKRFVARLEKKALQRHHSKLSSKHAKPSTCTESAEQAQKSTPAITPSSTLASATQDKSKKRKLRLSVLEQLVKKRKKHN